MIPFPGACSKGSIQVEMYAIYDGHGGDIYSTCMW